MVCLKLYKGQTGMYYLIQNTYIAVHVFDIVHYQYNDFQHCTSFQQH